MSSNSFTTFASLSSSQLFFWKIQFWLSKDQIKRKSRQPPRTQLSARERYTSSWKYLCWRTSVMKVSVLFPLSYTAQEVSVQSWNLNCSVCFDWESLISICLTESSTILPVLYLQSCCNETRLNGPQVNLHMELPTQEHPKFKDISPLVMTTLQIVCTKGLPVLPLQSPFPSHPSAAHRSSVLEDSYWNICQESVLLWLVLRWFRTWKTARSVRMISDDHEDLCSASGPVISKSTMDTLRLN